MLYNVRIGIGIGISWLLRLAPMTKGTVSGRRAPGTDRSAEYAKRQLKRRRERILKRPAARLQLFSAFLTFNHQPEDPLLLLVCQGFVICLLLFPVHELDDLLSGLLLLARCVCVS